MRSGPRQPLRNGNRRAGPVCYGAALMDPSASARSGRHPRHRRGVVGRRGRSRSWSREARARRPAASDRLRRTSRAAGCRSSPRTRRAGRGGRRAVAPGGRRRPARPGAEGPAARGHPPRPSAPAPRSCPSRARRARRSSCRSTSRPPRPPPGSRSATPPRWCPGWPRPAPAGCPRSASCSPAARRSTRPGRRAGEGAADRRHRRAHQPEAARATCKRSLDSKELGDPRRSGRSCAGAAARSSAVEAPPLDFGAPNPFVLLVIGVNGSGKTTTIGKLAAQLQGQGKSVLLAAGDTFRAAATEQLEVWGKRVGVPVVRGKEGADPSSVIFEAIKRAKAERIDVVIADTAGRLHTKTRPDGGAAEGPAGDGQGDGRAPRTRPGWSSTPPTARTRSRRPRSSRRRWRSPASC